MPFLTVYSLGFGGALRPTLRMALAHRLFCPRVRALDLVNTSLQKCPTRRMEMRDAPSSQPRQRGGRIAGRIRAARRLPITPPETTMAGVAVAATRNGKVREPVTERPLRDKRGGGAPRHPAGAKTACAARSYADSARAGHPRRRALREVRAVRRRTRHTGPLMEVRGRKRARNASGPPAA